MSWVCPNCNSTNLRVSVITQNGVIVAGGNLSENE